MHRANRLADSVNKTAKISCDLEVERIREGQLIYRQNGAVA
jgi:hypothetical protein